LHAGRFDISEMKPGDVRNVAFTFDVLDSLQEPTANVEISVADRDLRVVSSERAKFPVVKSALPIARASGFVSVPVPASVRGQPLAPAPVVGQLAKGSLLEQLGVLGDFTKVSLGEARFGFVETRNLRPASGAAAKVMFQPVLSHSPPLLEVSPASLSTRATKVRVSGQATDSDKVRDVFVFVGPRKVFYQSNRKASDPKKLEFEFDADLQPGMNVITVVARENEDSATRHTMVVRRDGPNGEPLPTPKAETLGEDWDLGDGH
jgi:carboxyl-terminal processing protease